MASNRSNALARSGHLLGCVKSCVTAVDREIVPARMASGDEEFDRVLLGAQRGEPGAFEELVNLLERPLVGFLRARGASDSESLANEVLVRVFGAIGGFAGTQVQFRAWVFTIARNLVFDEGRRQAKRPVTRLMDPGSLPETEAAPDDDHLDEMERAERLLGLLTDEQREVVVLRVIAGLSVEETAQVVGRRPGAVRALQHRALAQLRHQLSRKP